MQILATVIMVVLTTLFALIVIMAFRWTRNAAGFGGLAPTGLAGNVANAIGS